LADPNKRVAVLGAGAMGAIFGSAFARVGAEVVFFDNRSDVIEAITSTGLFLDGVFAATTTKLSATTVVAELGTVDLALVLVDSTATVAVANAAANCLSDHGCALTLQNGIGNWETLAARLGRSRVLAGSTYNSGANLGPGRARHTNLGQTIIGEIDGALSERVHELGRLLEAAGLPVEITDNVQGHIWSKFVHNCAINPISAVTRLRPGEIARTNAAAYLMDQLLDEVLTVVEAAGIRLPEVDPRGHIRDHCWERYNRPSMLQHLESGRGTEIDALNGALVHLARELGVPVPVNEAIVLMVKALEVSTGHQGMWMDEVELERLARRTRRGNSWG
jgi:2-dehydropantoate 2-reductase